VQKSEPCQRQGDTGSGTSLKKARIERYYLPSYMRCVIVKRGDQYKAVAAENVRGTDEIIEGHTLEDHKCEAVL